MIKITRRKFLQGATVIALAPTLSQYVQAGQSKLGWSATRNDGNDFHRAPVLLTGKNRSHPGGWEFQFSSRRGTS